MADADDDALTTVAPLLDQIAEAFSDVTPGAITLHEAERYRSDAPATLTPTPPRR